MSGELHHIVVMGVSGSGKTTVGEALAERLGWRFIEGDSFHPPENVAKMSAGSPLDANDRTPWLKALAAEIARDEGVCRVGCALESQSSNLPRDHFSGLCFYR
ncbi:gluconokinase [Shinella sp. YE25]|uniref:gluconokinase n=1 Tax=unclassified Shinella TaxID=2643062 RepID=UPI00225CDCE6|nr:gluconokinase [Shinella sp. YE25]CAI0334463.1 putative Gluconokinase [Rhizobiaceae bacterium]CAK7260642.1 gluconokinase [Shinella sp. WSC3-e]